MRAAENKFYVCVSPAGELELWRRDIYVNRNKGQSPIWVSYCVHPANYPVMVYIPRGRLDEPDILELTPEFYGRENLGEL